MDLMTFSSDSLEEPSQSGHIAHDVDVTSAIKLCFTKIGTAITAFMYCFNTVVSVVAHFGKRLVKNLGLKNIVFRKHNETLEKGDPNIHSVTLVPLFKRQRSAELFAHLRFVWSSVRNYIS